MMRWMPSPSRSNVSRSEFPRFQAEIGQFVDVVGGAAEGDPLFARLGKFKIGKSCVYVNRLSDIDLGVMEKIIVKSVAYMKKTYKTNGI